MTNIARRQRGHRRLSVAASALVASAIAVPIVFGFAGTANASAAMSTSQAKLPTSRIEGSGKVLRWVPTTLTLRAGHCGVHPGPTTSMSGGGYTLINTTRATQTVVSTSRGLRFEFILGPAGSGGNAISTCDAHPKTTIYSLVKDPKAKLTVKST